MAETWLEIPGEEVGMRGQDVEVSDDLIEIHDPEIDVELILKQIRERIRQRREELGYPQRAFPKFNAAAYPGEPEGENYDTDLYYHLRQANDLYYQIGVEVSLAPSLATQLPVLGRLWQRVRREAHNLVLFYLGKLVQRQVRVNRHLVSVLNRMAVHLQEQQRKIEALGEELDRLREQIEARQVNGRKGI